MTRYRTVDLLVTVLIGAAFGVAFLGYGQLYTLIGPLTAAFKPAEGLLAGIWFLPAVLAALLVRKPGAALLAEMVAAVLSMLLGSQWGWGTAVSGLMQGGGVELAFLLTRYRRFTLPVAVLGGVLSALLEWGWEKVAYYQEMSWAFSGTMLAFFLLSGALLCGVLGWAASRALIATGAVDSLASGREAARAVEA
ncbi:ECF transporter S component [Brachybacterium paraconglomeratum]|uniref:ABC transporter permease n=2 Tax=Brachybacterium TaxID=43668 RepID=A0A3R8QXC0_9MICO|nr:MULTISPECIES: ECF transporter S component [Brachybacterium]MDV3297029.1 ECF transporter S component [Brachybacterium paraconglomeratum]RRR20021.1 ABC transporter permease [Brachybacterium paraconglomeratum]GAP80411.1 substrate-specific component YkoE [Brachybacterium sp. SW0106-09]GLI31874.1 ABC transporter permease [Brachybacterium conglomeratum]GLK03407.1 ABC transporter permease [Brachybacterium conglomeratum]